MQDDAAETLLRSLREDDRLASWWLARPDGSVAGRGAGLPALLGAMRLTRPLGRLLARVPAGALDAAYHVVARNRGRLGRVVPEGTAPRRFP